MIITVFFFNQKFCKFNLLWLQLVLANSRSRRILFTIVNTGELKHGKIKSINYGNFTGLRCFKIIFQQLT